MSALHRSPRIRFPGTRAIRRAALVALHGAPPAELRDGRSWLRRQAPATFGVAVDGGISSWNAALRVRPDLTVGDGDSSTARPDLAYPRDKPFSDFAGALDEIARRRIRLVCVAGVLGGRLDHEWANVAELAAHAPRFAGIVAPSMRAWVVVTARGCRVETRPGRSFTLLALGGAATVTLSGPRWTLRSERLPCGSRGLSNESGRGLRLDVERGVCALVFPA